ncbi:SMI1/KNR4 family protein [Limnoglobus roseus]|uniref:SMI1/KNR4 family protein n=1 Tax=Limnoglobus roseus TaxID=2598579 RepID=A0A5C1APT1_9BACT|nr:SMI1/KNR4 family protein [Limnoglobus roseus]
MTEAEWLAGENLFDLYYFSRPLLSDRKAALFAVGCVRLTPLDAPHSVLRRASDVVEEAVDGQCDLDEVRSVNGAAGELCRSVVLDSPDHFKALAALRLTDTPVSSFVWQTALFLQKVLEDLPGTGGEPHAARRLHCRLLRDVVLQPFRGTRGQRLSRKRRQAKLSLLQREWQSATALGLAEGIYQDRAFDRMPILADALQDAGCENEDILSHCRQPGEHIRGCWVVDLLTGRN